MLWKIVDIISTSDSRIQEGTLFCDNYIVTDNAIIEYLESINAFENIPTKKQVGDKINLELSLAHLNTIGYFEDCETFIIKNRYSLQLDLYYIDEIKCYSSESNDFFTKYNLIINLINSIKKVAKHTYTDLNIDNSIIFREDKSIFLHFLFDASDIELIKTSESDSINSIIRVFNEDNTEKQLLFINELIDFLNPKDENSRFKFLLSQFGTLYDKCNNAYQFYLRDYSYNKLKIELDSKALDYTQRIQSVINDSQTKLIAIPTAFVLVFVAFDFNDLFAVKNIASILSLFIFAILIQLFLNNQKSTLSFIWENILSYKETFSSNSIETISSKFTLVEKELKKQKNRLRMVEFLLWSIPIVLTSLWLFLINYSVLLCQIKSLFIMIASIMKLFICL